MADRIHQQLTWPDWCRRLESLAIASATAEPDDQAGHLRNFHELVAYAPELALLEGVAVPGTALLESLLDCGACESAALAFVDSHTGCMVSRGGDGFHLASIALPGRGAEASASGTTMALAVLAALAAAIGSLAAARPKTKVQHSEAQQTLH